MAWWAKAGPNRYHMDQRQECQYNYSAPGPGSGARINGQRGAHEVVPGSWRQVSKTCQAATSNRT